MITTNQARGSVCEGELALDARGRITRAARPDHRAARRAPHERGRGLAVESRALHARRLRDPGLRHRRSTARSPRPRRSRPIAARAGPEACFFIERLIDTAARAIGLDPAELRRRNLIPADRFPFKHHHRPGLRFRRLSPGAGSRARGGRLRWAPPPPGRAAAKGRDRRGRGRVATSSRARSAGRAAVHPRGALGQGHRDHRVERARPGPRDDVRPGRGRSPRRHARRGHGRCTATRAAGPRASAPSAAAASRSAAARSLAVGRGAGQGPPHRGPAARGRAGGHRAGARRLPGGGGAAEARGVEGGRDRGLRGRRRPAGG